MLPDWDKKANATLPQVRKTAEIAGFVSIEHARGVWPNDPHTASARNCQHCILEPLAVVSSLFKSTRKNHGAPHFFCSAFGDD
nr:hypothetical protein [Mesorhizobium sp.]